MGNQNSVIMDQKRPFDPNIESAEFIKWSMR